jgi:hypothetical protein
MRALRLPLPSETTDDVITGQPTVPAWIIDGGSDRADDRREAPRLEVPSAWPSRDRERPGDRTAVESPLPGSTVIVVPL